MRLLVLFVGVFVSLCLSVQAAPSVEVQPSMIIGIVGTDVEFHCMATVEEGSEISWKKEDAAGIPLLEINANTPGFEVATVPSENDTIHNTLRILDIKVASEGHYQCNYGNGRATGILEVKYAPSVEVQPSMIIGIVGTDVEFHCTATIEEGSEISWKKEDADSNQLLEINANTPGFEVATVPSDNSTIHNILRIFDIKVASEGFYQCDYGTGRATGVLEVSYEGIVEITGSRVIDGAGETDKKFTCLVKGDPSYNVTWKKGDIELPSKTLPQIEIEGSTMTIKAANVKKDRGTYICSALYETKEVSGNITVGDSASGAGCASARPLSAMIVLRCCISYILLKMI